MAATPPPEKIPEVAVLGAHAAAFIAALEQALSAAAVPGAVRLQACQGLTQAGVADLRWLLAWEDPQGLEALQAQQALRADLHARGLAYQVLRGTPPERIAQALHSLAPWLPALAARLPQAGVRSRRPGWSCGECSDPQCEHLSFRQLLAGRQH